jgi:hypothetical protein
MADQTAPKAAKPKGAIIALREVATSSSSSSSEVYVPGFLETDQHDQNNPSGQRNGVRPNRLALAQEMSPAELSAASKSLRRKLDLRLISMAWLMFVFNYFDRVRGSSRILSDEGN